MQLKPNTEILIKEYLDYKDSEQMCICGKFKDLYIEYGKNKFISLEVILERDYISKKILKKWVENKLGETGHYDHISASALYNKLIK